MEQRDCVKTRLALCAVPQIPDNPESLVQLSLVDSYKNTCTLIIILDDVICINGWERLCDVTQCGLPKHATSSRDVIPK